MAGSTRLNSEQRQKLILEHYPMVRQVAYRMVSRFPSCVEADDLIAIGTLGLIDAVDRFEHDRKVSFSAYARIRVQGAILDELRKNDWVPRSVRTRAARIRMAREELRDALGREPEDHEVAESLGMDLEALRELERNARLRALVSMEEGADDEDRVADRLASDLPTPVEVADRAELRRLVREAIATLPERDQLIVRMYYFEERTSREIAERLGVTESRISQLHSRIRKRLGARLEAVAAT